MVNQKAVYFAKNMADTMFQLKTTSNLKICGGCTQIKELPSTSLIIRNISDFKTIDRKERYMDLGSAVTLSQILELGSKRIPAVLYEIINSIANPFIRNIATIGGNICATNMRYTLFAPLLAMDARLELKSQAELVNVPIMQFDGIPAGFMLSKIRVPLNEWDVTVFKRIGPANKINDNSASFVFLANTQKGFLTDLRIAFCGVVSFRNRELENILIGARLPLSKRDIVNMLEQAEKIYDEELPVNLMSQELPEESLLKILKNSFLNLLSYSLEQLT